MHKFSVRFLYLVAILLSGSPASADQTKQLTIEPGKATVVANLVSPRPDCSTNPGPQLLPSITEKPLHGTIGIQIAVTDVAAAGACPARKVPSLALFYAAPAGYTGSDSFQIEINEGNNQQTRVSYQVTVQAALPQPSAAPPTAAKP